jgi:hypothetical protein
MGHDPAGVLTRRAGPGRLMARTGPWAVAGALLVSATACAGDDDASSSATGATAGAPAATSAASPPLAGTTTPATSAPPATAPPATTTPATTLLTIPPRASFPDDVAAIEAVATTTFQYPGSPLTPEEAHCVADALVHVFGRSRVEEFGFGIGRWTLLGFAIALGPWDRADSEAVVDIFSVCSPNWELLGITSSTQGAEAISAASARCVADALPDDVARELFVDGLDRPPGLPEDELKAQARTFYEGCLTPGELAGLDFD